MRPRGLEDVVQPPETQASGLFGIGLHTSEVDLDAGLVVDHPGVDELGDGDGHDDDPAHRRVVEGDAGIPRDDVELLRLRGDTVRSLDGPAGSDVRRRADPAPGARRPLPPARGGRAAERRPTSAYLMPITIESGPIRCSARVSANPASSIQPMQSAAV